MGEGAGEVGEGMEEDMVDDGGGLIDDYLFLRRFY